jgi:diacylglycerol kinase family enzyme
MSRLESYDHAVIITNDKAAKFKNLNLYEFKNMINDEVIAPLKRFGINRCDILNQPTILDLDSIRNDEEDYPIAICGGDGTISPIVNYAASETLPNILIPRPCGCANDIATNLYNNMRLEDILASASPEVAYTIEAIIEKGAEQKIIRALGYFGIGASAEASRTINEYRGTDKTKLATKLRAARAVLNSQPFGYLDPSGNTQKSLEISIINYRMGGLFKCEQDTTFITEATIYEAKKTLQIISTVCLGLLGIAKGIRIKENQIFSMQTVSDTALQYDGEYINIKPDTNITIKSGPPVNVMRVDTNR